MDLESELMPPKAILKDSIILLIYKNGNQMVAIFM